jgi:hypothetical protein
MILALFDVLGLKVFAIPQERYSNHRERARE